MNMIHSGTDLRAFQIHDTVCRPYRDVTLLMDRHGLRFLQNASDVAAGVVADRARRRFVRDFNPTDELHVIAQVPLTFPSRGFAIPFSWASAHDNQILNDVVATIHFAPSEHRTTQTRVMLTAEYDPEPLTVDGTRRPVAPRLVLPALEAFATSVVAQLDEHEDDARTLLGLHSI